MSASPRRQRGHQRRGGVGRVGVVAVDHEVVVGLHVAEHRAHHVALALPGLAAHHGAVLAGDLGRAVGGVVVVDVDDGGSGSAARKSSTTLPMVTASL